MRAKEFINENVPATVTDTEREEAQTAYMQGQCMILAIAINQLNPKRYPIGYIWEYNADAGVPDMQLDDDEWENLSPQEQEEISKDISRHSVVHAYVRDRETNEYIDARGRHRDIPNLWGRLGVTRFEEFPGTARELIDITANGEWDEVGEQVNFKRGQPAFDSLAGPAGVKRAQDYAVKYLNIDPGPASQSTPKKSNWMNPGDPLPPSSPNSDWVILGPYKNVLYRFSAANEQRASAMKDQWCKENNVDPGSCRLKYDGEVRLGQPRNMAAATTNDGITNAAYLHGLRHGREGAGDNMDRARAEWGDDFKYYNAGFLKGRNEKAQSLKAVGQGYGNKEQGVAEGIMSGPGTPQWAGSVAKAKTVNMTDTLWHTHQNVRSKHMAQLARDAGHTPTPSMISAEKRGIRDDEKRRLSKQPTQGVAEGWKEGVGYTVLAGLLSLGAINRLGDLVNSAVTGEPTQSFLNRNSGINKLNDIKTTTGQGIESIKSVSSGGDKKFEMMLSDGRKVRFTTTDLERAKKIAAARQASEPVEVKEQGVAENFADGRNPQDKGDAKRHGINTKASVSSLRKTAKQGGRKGQLAHWMANMKAGQAKAKKK